MIFQHATGFKHILNFQSDSCWINLQVDAYRSEYIYNTFLSLILCKALE